MVLLIYTFFFLYVVCPDPVAVTAPWIIAIAIIVALLIAGILALLLLKLLLFIIVRMLFYSQYNDLSLLYFQIQNNNE